VSGQTKIHLQLILKTSGEKLTRIEKVNEKRKVKFDSHYKTKVINIGDNVRLDAPATKLGIKTKIRGDLWSGPFKVIGKSDNGNLN
jgi:hypothetical protein